MDWGKNRLPRFEHGRKVRRRPCCHNGCACWVFGGKKWNEKPGFGRVGGEHRRKPCLGAHFPGGFTPHQKIFRWFRRFSGGGGLCGFQLKISACVVDQGAAANPAQLEEDRRINNPGRHRLPLRQCHRIRRNPPVCWDTAWPRARRSSCNFVSGR